MMWYRRKAAFRVGRATGTQWDHVNIGQFSTSMGASTTESGFASTAMGYFTTASGSQSTAKGRSSRADAFVSMAIGRYNVRGGDDSTWVSTDPLFEIGNGTLSTARANALTVIKNGNVGIGTSTPAFKLEVNGSAGKPGGGSRSVASDARLKKDVEDLDGALETLLALRGVTFEYIDPAAVNELEGRRTGFIAQEVEQVLPDWVSEKDDGTKYLSIRGFEALTVEALRELSEAKDARFAELQAENESLRDCLERVERALERIDALER